MVRTKSDRVGTKSSGSKPAAKGAKASSSTGPKLVIFNKRSGGGGPRVALGPTPEWQKPITRFFNQSSNEGDNGAGSSTSLGEQDPGSKQDGDTDTEDEAYNS